MKGWEKYLAAGFVKKQKPNFHQIEQQVLRAEKDLRTFDFVIGADPEWASSIAYQAMIRLGRALIYSHGFLPADGRQHKTVVEVTRNLLGSEYTLLVNYFDRMRRNRNVFFYDSLDANNCAQAKKAFETAVELLKVIIAKIREKNPQFRLD